MRTYVTLVRDIELDRIKMSFKNSNYFAIIFDGSSRVDEVLAVIARYVTKGNNICLITVTYQLTSIISKFVTISRCRF